MTVLKGSIFTFQLMAADCLVATYKDYSITHHMQELRV